ncbi:MAG TPA: T9SS type A sorting domain-containing protein [Bacteroidia bacterium]|nr:T9SS type A sorting domain-containing protein [Bacteroidia bacterium]
MFAKIKVLTAALVILTATSQAQIVYDTVSLGAGYANQKWYSLQNDEQGSAPKNNWDIAFECAPYGTSILINSVTGTKLWLYATGDTATWNTLDTTGMAATWPLKYNSDTSWYFGAFSQPQTSQYDLGWGIYNPITHFVDGDSLYVIKLANNSYRKIWIKQLNSGSFIFRYGTLDNSFDTTVTVQKSTFSGDLFGYYSLQNNAELDREPAQTSWDILFTQYTTFLPTPYGVTGVLSNNGVLVAQAVPVDVTTNDWWSQTFVTPINEIGYDWKTLNMSTFQYDITDSLVYFVQDQAGDIWKVIFTGFGGSANGNYMFSKEKISSTGFNDGEHQQSFGLYPNPAVNGSATVVTTLGASQEGTVTATDITGKVIHTEQLQGAGLQQTTLNTSTWSPGIYFITVLSDGISLTQKLVVQ